MIFALMEMVTPKTRVTLINMRTDEGLTAIDMANAAGCTKAVAMLTQCTHKKYQHTLRFVVESSLL